MTASREQLTPTENTQLSQDSEINAAMLDFEAKKKEIGDKIKTRIAELVQPIATTFPEITLSGYRVTGNYRRETVYNPVANAIEERGLEEGTIEEVDEKDYNGSRLAVRRFPDGDHIEHTRELGPASWIRYGTTIAEKISNFNENPQQ